ncbi:MAG: antibiotic biosynthesis monooxygenase [Planctomycetota bacterium]|nr:MAG: antibiotic biosynthesis monooxygenase [Planctomycetota bacterium]
MLVWTGFPRASYTSRRALPDRAGARCERYARRMPNARYAVIFASQRPRPAAGSGAPSDGYGEVADRMVELASRQPGFVAVESARGADGFGITVSYWTDRAAIEAWRDEAEHRVAQRLGRERFYDSFHLVVAELVEERSFERAR